MYRSMYAVDVISVCSAEEICPLRLRLQQVGERKR